MSDKKTMELVRQMMAKKQGPQADPDMLRQAQRSGLETMGRIAREKDDSAKFAVESPDQSYELPQATEQGTDQAVSGMNRNMSELPTNKYSKDQQLLDMLKKSQGPNSLDDVEVTPETISDPNASIEMKKQAWNKVQKKYLGA